MIVHQCEFFHYTFAYLVKDVRVEIIVEKNGSHFAGKLVGLFCLLLMPAFGF